MRKIICVENKSQVKNDGNLYVWRNWDQEGALNYEGETTLKHYHELKAEISHKDHKGIFYAFSDQQFMDGLKKIGIPEDDYKGKVFKFYGGGFGTKEGIRDMMKYLNEMDNRVKDECDPQEVYMYEYNNHECMLDWDGDERAIELIIDTWGVDVAKTIKRFSACKSVDDIANDK